MARSSLHTELGAELTPLSHTAFLQDSRNHSQSGKLDRQIIKQVQSTSLTWKRLSNHGCIIVGIAACLGYGLRIPHSTGVLVNNVPRYSGLGLWVLIICHVRLLFDISYRGNWRVAYHTSWTWNDLAKCLSPNIVLLRVCQMIIFLLFRCVISDTIAPFFFHLFRTGLSLTETGTLTYLYYVPS